MTESARAERTARLLTGRLEVVARAAGRMPQLDVQRLVELASAATAHAVALDLLEPRRAHAIWRDARRRQPHLRALQATLPEPLVAPTNN